MAVLQEVGVWRPFKCDGFLDDGRACGKTIANVREGTPESVRVVCPRCGKWHKLPKPSTA